MLIAKELLISNMKSLLLKPLDNIFASKLNICTISLIFSNNEVQNCWYEFSYREKVVPCQG